MKLLFLEVQPALTLFYMLCFLKFVHYSLTSFFLTNQTLHFNLFQSISSCYNKLKNTNECFSYKVEEKKYNITKEK